MPWPHSFSGPPARHCRRRAAVRVAAAALALAGLLAACSGGGSRASAPVVQGTVTWVPCRGSAGPSGYQCASIEVPRDPASPGSGGTIAMALDRRPASGRPLGTIVVNPGGPGASGVDFLPSMVEAMPASMLRHFDVVSFDPPGVARTAPIVCLGNAGLAAYMQEDPAPDTAAGMQAFLAEARRFAQGCEQRSAAELPYVSTVDAAMDMDVLRRDLGQAKLTYMGFSYGTFLGATYAGLYPDHVRAMVLDGAIDPDEGVIAGLDEQSDAIEGNLDAALTSCQKSSSCPWKPAGNAVAAYQALQRRVEAHPVPVPGTDRSVGPAELLYGTAAALYATSTWSDLDQALAQLAAGDGSDMLQLFDAYTGRSSNGTYTNELEANAAVNCLDSPAPSVAAVEAAAPAAEKAAPVFGVANLYSEIQCALWPVPATGKPAPIHADGSPPILVVGTTDDPATPYKDAVALASQLQHGVLLTRVGYGHTAYFYSSCIRGYVDSYLTDLTLPPTGERCPSN